MSDLMNKTLDQLAADILKDGVIDAKEAAMIRERVFADGKVDREEADFLFRLNDGVSGKANPAWQQIFVQAVTAHLLGDDKSPGELDADEAAYLQSKISGDGKVDDAERALLVNVVKKAKSAPESFQSFVLATMKTAVLADGVIDEGEVAQLRTVVYGSGGGSGAKIDRAEADFLFELNNGVSGKLNHPAWKELFVQAVSGHVLEDEASPGVVDEAEAAWLISKVEGDGKIDDNEKALLLNIKSKAKSIPPNLQQKLSALGL